MLVFEFRKRNNFDFKKRRIIVLYDLSMAPTIGYGPRPAGALQCRKKRNFQYPYVFFTSLKIPNFEYHYLFLYSIGYTTIAHSKYPIGC